MTNHRIQLRRSSGWRKPEGSVVVARPTRWGNPYALHGDDIVHPDGRSWRADEGGARALAVELYREDLLHGRLAFGAEQVRAELAGRDLACWCPLDLPCHADVLLVVANVDPT